MTISSIDDLKPDKRNARKRTVRNLSMIKDALQEVGASRSIVIDEDGAVLAGNGVVEAAPGAGIKRVQVVDADGETIIAVRRTGLSEEAKRRLAYYDNRAGELAEWDPEQIAADVKAGLNMAGLFQDSELEKMLNPQDQQERPEVEFSEELLLEHNYIVLYFDNPMDWQVACDRFGLHQVKSADPCGECQKIGIGRVVRGATVLQ